VKVYIVTSDNRNRGVFGKKGDALDELDRRGRMMPGANHLVTRYIAKKMTKDTVLAMIAGTDWYESREIVAVSTAQRRAA
jgi:hypothetical protein